MSYGTPGLREEHVHVAGQAPGDRVDREAHLDTFRLRSFSAISLTGCCACATAMP
jgi:hypothetical protein